MSTWMWLFLRTLIVEPVKNCRKTVPASAQKNPNASQSSARYTPRSIGASWTLNSPVAVSTCSSDSSVGGGCACMGFRSVASVPPGCAPAALESFRGVVHVVPHRRPGGDRVVVFDRGHHRLVFRDRGIPEIGRVEVVLQRDEQRPRPLLPQ